jgi:HD-like signal output (HDOD) protein
VQQLGLTTVRSLVLSAQVYSSFAPGRLKHFSADALWSHLMKCGDLARAIMRRERRAGRSRGRLHRRHVA